MINCCINVAEFVTVIWHADKKVLLLSKLSIHFTPITIITFVKYELGMERKKKGENSYGNFSHFLNLINRGDAIRGRKENRGDAAGGMEYQKVKKCKIY